jgi:hypothetical protein
MSIKKMSLVAAGAAVLMLSMSVMAELSLTPYGAAQYRFRGQILSGSGEVPEPGHHGKEKDSGLTAVNYRNLVSWQAGVKAKVDDQLSLQFQIGNDWNSGEEVAWASNNAPHARNTAFQNIYVHLAYFAWNPGQFYLSAGVIPVVSHGPLDLLERSLSRNSYDEAIFQGWSTQLNNSLIGFKFGAPILQDDLKISAELTTSVVRNDGTTLVSGNSLTSAGNVFNPDPTVGRPGVLLLLDVPIATGDLKVTPQFAGVINRFYGDIGNDTRERAGSHEFIGGFSAGYKVSDDLNVNGSFAYGAISDWNSAPVRHAADKSKDNKDIDKHGSYKYDNSGWLVGVGGTLKAGPGVAQLDFKIAGSDNKAVSEDLEGRTNIYIDPRYTIKLHEKVTIMPRYRLYFTTYEDKWKKNATGKIEQRPELSLIGSF